MPVLFFLHVHVHEESMGMTDMIPYDSRAQTLLQPPPVVKLTPAKPASIPCWLILISEAACVMTGPSPIQRCCVLFFLQVS